MKRNVWIQQDNEVVEWVASVDALVADPEAIIAMLTRVAAVGAKHELVMFDGDPIASLRTQLMSQRNLRVGLDDEGLRAAAYLCTYGGANDLHCEPVRDLGEVLEQLAGGEGSIPRDFRVRRGPPVRVWGSTLRFDKGQWRSGAGGAKLFVTTYSDIWFPYVTGLAQPDRREGAFFDNSELARVNTPRLNAFLQDLGAILNDFEIDLALHEDGEGVYRPWVHDRGILLDTLKPSVIVEETSADKGRVTEFVFDYGNEHAPNRIGRVLVTFRGDKGVVEVLHKRPPSLHEWRAQLPAPTWNNLLAALERSGFPAEAVIVKAPVPGTPGETLTWVRGGVAETVRIDGGSHTYSEINRIVWNVVDQVAPGIVGGAQNVAALPGNAVFDVRESSKSIQ